MSVHARIDPPHRLHAARAGPRLNSDTAFVLIAFATSLFILVLPKFGPAIFIALVLLQAGYRPDGFVRMLYRTGPILLIPAYCMLSSAWSSAPQATLYAATLYLITVMIGLIAGSMVGARALLGGLFAAFAAYAAACFTIAVGTGFFWSGEFGRSPLVVLAGSKNVNGDVAALGTMIAVTTLAVAMRRRHIGWMLASLALVAVELLLLAAALSTGAIVSMLVGLSVIVLLTCSSVLPAAARSLALVIGIVFSAAATLTQNIWLHPIFAAVLKAGGKDSTFTGRLYIWSRAKVLIEQKPVLGVGFGAFWRPGNLEAEAIWKRLNIPSKSGFNFHNTRLDILVHLGYVGLVLFAVIFGVYGGILLLRAIRKPDPISIFLIAVLCYEATRMGFESIGYGTFHHATFLLFAALAWGVRRIRGAGSGTAGRSAAGQPLRLAGPLRAR